MANLMELRRKMLSVAVYSNMWSDKYLNAMWQIVFCDETNEQTVMGGYCNLFKSAVEIGHAESVGLHIEKVMLSDDNAFTRALAKCISPAEVVVNAAINEINIMAEIAQINTDTILKLFPVLTDCKQYMPQILRGKTPKLFRNLQNSYSFLCEYHKVYGCGVFSTNYAFMWNDGVVPIVNTDPITLDNLKGYETQRGKILDNTEAFIEGLPASNMLIYGDKGTGKSSTVHAILNEYHNKGLRMLEVQRESLHDLPTICDILGDLPQKFIIFIDDLSFDGWSEDFSALKAVLEGSLSARPQNVIIYATSNRRHLVREYQSDRSLDDVNSADAREEMLSLSDRFGITVTFLNPAKAQYLEIVDQLAIDEKLDIDKDKLSMAAERWALTKAGRSPRGARQFIDYVKSRLARNLDI